VVTRNGGWSAEGVVTVASLDEAIAKGFEENSEEVMIIGGGEIYRQAMPLATNLYITEVDADVPDADTFFPEVDLSQWRIVSE
jgi:dihydrofolate reductase